ncbi:MAG: M2 family metallopeptidase, partial [Acidobacteriota bacterium]
MQRYAATVFVSTLVLVLGLVACSPPAEEAATDDGLQAEVQAFLDAYTTEYLQLYTTANEAEWASNTHIVDGDDTNRQRTEAANEALAQFTGSVATIEKARTYLERRDALQPLQVRQLESVLYTAANFPQLVPELVKQRIAAEAAQVESLFGFDFQLDGASVSANDIDNRLAASVDPAERQEVWEASKEVGTVLKDGLEELVEVRNGTVQALGYDDYFAYQVSDYGMSVEEMMQLNHGFV